VARSIRFVNNTDPSATAEELGTLAIGKV